MFTDKQIKEGIDIAYQKLGTNAYFANGFEAGVEFAINNIQLSDNQINEIISRLSEYGTIIDKYCYGLPQSTEDFQEMKQIINTVIKTIKDNE